MTIFEFEYFYLLIILSGAGIFYLFGTKSAISPTVTDFAVFAFLLYGLLHTGIIQGFKCDPLVWFKWTAVLFVYLFFRRLKKPRVYLVPSRLFRAISAIFIRDGSQ
jgi:hypothetical protein